MTQLMASRPTSGSLAKDRLGVPSVVFFLLSAIAPLTFCAGVVTTAYAVTGLTAIPAAFIVVAVIVALFSVGYVAMARRIVNAGAFYSFVSHGLGRPAGVGAAFTAVLAYNALQVGLYGIFGPTLADYVNSLTGWQLSWWVYALIAWAITAMLGLIAVDVNGKVLAVLLSLEVAIIVTLAVIGLSKPAGGRVDFGSLAPAGLLTAGSGALLVTGILGFIGFEQATNFAEEVRNPGRTVRIATFTSIGLIAIVYAGASFSLEVAYGPSNVAQAARDQGPGMLFSLGGSRLAEVAQILFITSIFAATLSFHNAVARYMFALGRERVLPAIVGKTSARTGSPQIASLLQSAVGFAVIVTIAAAGFDPLVHLFFWVGTSGAFGVLILLAATSLAVIGFFLREHGGETIWRRMLAPGLALLALTALIWKALDDYPVLLGVAPGHAAAWILPSMFVVAAGLGILWAVVLRRSRRDVYDSIGSGPQAGRGTAGHPT